MREIKTSFVSIDEGTLLLHMITQDLAQGFMQEMGCAVVTYRFYTDAAIDSGLNKIADL